MPAPAPEAANPDAPDRQAGAPPKGLAARGDPGTAPSEAASSGATPAATPPAGRGNGGAADASLPSPRRHPALRRIARIVLAYIAGTLTLVTILPVVGVIGDLLFERNFPDEGLVHLYLIGLMTGVAYVFAFLFGAVPALLWIILSEALHIRRRATHLAVAALASAAAWLVFVGRNEPWLLVARSTVDLALAGLLAGLVYWAIAGRSAGAWRAPAAP